MKIKSLLYTALASTLLFASCDLNKQPVFDDDQAYVAFDASTGIVKEAVDGNPAVIELTLTAGSLEGVTTEVTFATDNESYDEAVRAVEGVDYKIIKVDTYQLINGVRSNVVTAELTAESAKVINFDADHRFASIYVETINNDVQGGDKKFDVVLTASSNSNLGAHDVFTITISDDEDPMNMLVGTYNATAPSAFSGYPDESWEVTITRDDEADNKLWIHPLCLFGGLSAGYINPASCVVDIEMGTLQIPYGQTLYGAAEGASYHMVNAGLADPPATSGASMAVFDITGTNVTIQFQDGFGVGDLLSNTWWYQALQAPTLVKQ